MAGVTRDAGYVDYNSAGDGTTVGQLSKYIPVLFAKKALRRFYETSIYPAIANTDLIF